MVDVVYIQADVRPKPAGLIQLEAAGTVSYLSSEPIELWPSLFEDESIINIKH